MNTHEAPPMNDSLGPRRPLIGPRVPTTGFRLDADSQRALDERATGLNISSHELARRYVLASLKLPPSPPDLSAPDPAELLEGLQAVFYHLLETRKDIALAVEVLLSQAGQVSETEAHAWVRQNYPDVCSPSNNSPDPCSPSPTP